MNAWALALCFLLSVSYLVPTTAAPADQLLDQFGEDDQLNATQTQTLFEKMGIADWAYNGSTEKVRVYMILNS